MKRLILCVLLVVGLLGGCTKPSTEMAWKYSAQSQFVHDTIHRDAMNALAAENYAMAKVTILLAAEKAKVGVSPEAAKAIDGAAAESIDALKELAIKRDMMVTWTDDYAAATALKYVTVDAKLYSEEGYLNYVGRQFSAGMTKVLAAWDKAVTSQPATK